MSIEKYINSSYLSAANALNGKRARRKITVYVESYDDVFFWRSILSTLESSSLFFQVMLPTRSRKLERGKKAAIMAVLQGNVGPDMIACVDADYDFLKQGSNAFSAMVCNNPYVFHTYAYAIENLQCWAPSLRELCVAITLNDNPQIFDFESFLQAYSEIIYPLFVWSIVSARWPLVEDFSMPDFTQTIKTGNVGRHNKEHALARVADKVRRKMSFINTNATSKAHKLYAETDADIRRLGIVPGETYLYVRGHSLFTDVVLPIVTSECNILMKQREQEICMQSKHKTQRDNEISCYEHSVSDIETMLKKNTQYLRSPQVERIMGDLKTFLSTQTTTNEPNQ